MPEKKKRISFGACKERYMFETDDEVSDSLIKIDMDKAYS